MYLTAETTAAINECGARLSQDAEAYEEAKQLFEKLNKSLRSPVSVQVLEQSKDVANRVGFPSEFREADSLQRCLNEILNVARRFRQQQRLATVAGAESFTVGLFVIRHKEYGIWVEGFVVAIHPNGTFTFRASDRKGVVLDPCNQVTVCPKEDR